MLTVSKLREAIYGLLRQGRMELRSTGDTATIVPKTPAPKLAGLKKRRAYKGKPDEILSMDWLKEWSELK
jgi:hypothetical protein